MAQVLDYSAGFPGAQAILSAGYVGAVRYIGFPDRAKCTNAGELTDFSAHGLGMALVFENTLTDWRGGYNAGQVSGRLARNHANSIGFPATRPIYMAVDQDVVTSGEFATMLDYLRGAGSVLGGPQLTGVYGEADVIDAARNAGVATWYWQTQAWSRGRLTAAQLLQHVGTVYVGGVGCDVNDILAPDWGQHTEEAMPSIDEIVAAMKFRVLAADDFRFDGRNPLDMAKQGMEWSGQAAAATGRIEAVLAQVLAAVAGGGVNPQDVLARVDTAVRESTTKAVTDTILPAVARIEAALAADNTAEAKAIVAELGAQLRPAA